MSKAYIYFQSKDCALCKQHKEKVHFLASVMSAHRNKDLFVQIDVSENPSLANQCRITRLPSIAVCENDTVKQVYQAEQVGAVLDQLKAQVAKGWPDRKVILPGKPG